MGRAPRRATRSRSSSPPSTRPPRSAPWSQRCPSAFPGSTTSTSSSWTTARATDTASVACAAGAEVVSGTAATGVWSRFPDRSRTPPSRSALTRSFTSTGTVSTTRVHPARRGADHPRRSRRRRRCPPARGRSRDHSRTRRRGNQIGSWFFRRFVKVLDQRRHLWVSRVLSRGTPAPKRHL